MGKKTVTIQYEIMDPSGLIIPDLLEINVTSSGQYRRFMDVRDSLALVPLVLGYVAVAYPGCELISVEGVSFSQARLQENVRMA